MNIILTVEYNNNKKNVFYSHSKSRSEVFLNKDVNLLKSKKKNEIQNTNNEQKNRQEI